MTAAPLRDGTYQPTGALSSSPMPSAMPATIISDPADHRRGRARAGPQGRVGDDEQAGERDGDEAAGEMAAGGGAGLTVPEGVVEHPQGRGGQREAEQARLGARRPDGTGDGR